MVLAFQILISRARGESGGAEFTIRGEIRTLLASQKLGSTVQLEVFDCDERRRTLDVPTDRILALFADLDVKP